MAVFIGNLKEFSDFIGPVARNIVCNMSRNFKKNTTCRHDGCNKRKPLEAAHIKGKDRPTIIADILADYKISDDKYEVELNEFKIKFINAHTPITEIILPMCKEHHLAYDKANKIAPEIPTILYEFENEVGESTYTEEELEDLEKKELIALEKAVKQNSIADIKDKLSKELNLSKQQISVSNISEANGLWNFDVNKDKFYNDFAFVFFNNKTQAYKVALFKANTLPVNKFGNKNEGQIVRFFVDQEYKDRSGYQF